MDFHQVHFSALNEFGPKLSFSLDYGYALRLHETTRSAALQQNTYSEDVQQLEDRAVVIGYANSDGVNTAPRFVTYNSVATGQNVFLNLLGCQISPEYLITFKA
jgi:hypothetical protein